MQVRPNEGRWLLVRAGLSTGFRVFARDDLGDGDGKPDGVTSAMGMISVAWLAKKACESVSGRWHQAVQGVLSLLGRVSVKAAVLAVLTPNCAFWRSRLCSTSPSVTVWPTLKGRGGWPSTAIKALPKPEAPATTPSNSKRVVCAMLTSGAGA